MSEQSLLLKHWRMLLVTLLLSLAFALVFLASVERARTSRSAELSLDTGGASAAPNQQLTLTKRLGELPIATPAPAKPVQPAPWWPALLFSLAFFCGWLFRNSVIRHYSAATQGRRFAQATQRESSDVLQEVVTAPDSVTKESDVNVPDLAVDFPWDEAALSDDEHLTSAERIRKLEKQNASKVEIIKALERLVAENREKWLHQDETEARLDKHIQDLSQDLAVAVRQLQRLQKAPAAVRKTAKSHV